MKPAAPRIEPNEGHIIKATAWDALYAAWTIELEANREHATAARMLKTMDNLLNQVGEKYSTAETWGAIMPKKFENDDLYRCLACASATAKTDWEQALTLSPDPRDIGFYHVCPKCGCLQDLSITNENPPEVPAPPEPEKPAPPKKPAAKK